MKHGNIPKWILVIFTIVILSHLDLRFVWTTTHVSPEGEPLNGWSGLGWAAAGFVFDESDDEIQVIVAHEFTLGYPHPFKGGYCGQRVYFPGWMVAILYLFTLFIVKLYRKNNKTQPGCQTK